MTPLSDQELDTLATHRWLTRDGFLGRDLARAAHAEAGALRAAGALRPAGIRREATHAPDIRGDQLTWLTPDPARPALTAAAAHFAALRHQINTTLWLGLTDQEIQLACYPGDGTGYARHLDAFPGSLNRRITALCYLNPGWTPAAGGALHLWTPTGEHTLLPLLDRLVIFFSEHIPHAVAPTHAERWALTAWLRRRDPDRPAL